MKLCNHGSDFAIQFIMKIAKYLNNSDINKWYEVCFPGRFYFSSLENAYNNII